MTTTLPASAWIIRCSVALALLGLDTSAVGASPPLLRIVCSTTDLAALTRAVGGTAVDVQAIARGSQDPHHVQAKPSTMRLLNRADLLIFNGMQLEIGWLPLLIEGARNPRVADGSRGQLNLSAAITPLEVPDGPVDRSMGDVHPEGNPHYTLDPRNALPIAALIARRLTLLNPDLGSVVATQHGLFIDAMQLRLKQWEADLSSWRGRKVISYHKQFEYLADWLGIEVVDYVEDRPGISPTPRHLKTLVERMRQQHINVILQSTFANQKRGRRFAERADARLIVLPAAVGSVDGTQDYLRLIDLIVERLVAELKEAENGI